jgi:acetyl esterase/lipase
VTAFLVLGATTALRLPADGKLDLERNTPVPANEVIPLVDFFRPTLLQEPKLNPSGTHIAALVTAGEDRHELLVVELKSSKLDGFSGGGDNDIFEVTWLDDQHLIFGIAVRKSAGIGLYAAEVGDLRSCYPLLQYVGSTLIAVPPQKRMRPLMWIHSGSLNAATDAGMVATINAEIRSGGIINLFKAGGDPNSVNSAVMDAQASNDKHILSRQKGPKGEFDIGFTADKEGRLEFGFTAMDGVSTMHHLVGDRWEKCPVDLEEIDILGCGNQPGQLVVVGPRQDGRPRALQFMEGATGKLGEVLLQDNLYDFHGWLYRDPVSHAVVGAMYERNGPKTVWFDENYAKLQKIMDGYFPGVVVRILGNDEAGKRFLLVTYSDRQPGNYYWVDLEKHAFGPIKQSRPWIDPGRMQPMNVMKFKTRDGRKLDAYVTLPAGASKANPPPLVVLSHGGPWVRDGWAFNGEVQFLASRGYAVLQTNYRGSPGYGWMFPKSDEWDFRKMHDDVTDAAKALIASGVVDGGRVAIMGGSFGGYLALMGIVNEPTLYCCAVAISGVFDWEQLIGESKYYRYSNDQYARLLRKLGDPKMDPKRFDAIAPVRHVDRIRVPVFVSHGGDDPIVDIAQSKRLISELEKNHVPHESLVVGDEVHGMSHLDNRVDLYARIEAFLARNLAPAKRVTAPAGTQ